MNDTKKSAFTISRTVFDLNHLLSQDTPTYGDPQSYFELISGKLQESNFFFVFSLTVCVYLT
jgi:hypothetical protein